MLKRKLSSLFREMLMAHFDVGPELAHYLWVLALTQCPLPPAAVISPPIHPCPPITSTQSHTALCVLSKVVDRECLETGIVHHKMLEPNMILKIIYSSHIIF